MSCFDGINYTAYSLRLNSVYVQYHHKCSVSPKAIALLEKMLKMF